MRGRDLALLIALASPLALAAPVRAQQPSPWPAPPSAQSPPATWPNPPATDQPAPPPKRKKTAKKKPPAQEPPDPRFEEEPGLQPADGPPPPPAGAPPPAPRKRAAVPALDIRCDGAFAKNTTFANLVKTFGARNVFSQPGGTTILFPNDPTRRAEITWRDVVGRVRPAMILVEAQSTWRVRGFRLGDPMTQVEKVNGRPFRLTGFGATSGGNARDWQGGKLDKLSGGCMLGMRFAAATAPPDVLAKLNVAGDLISDNPDMRAARPVIVELIVAYPE